MGIASLENQIAMSLKYICKNRKIKRNDIQEWSTGPIIPQDGEVVVRTDDGIYVAIKKELDLRDDSTLTQTPNGKD